MKHDSSIIADSLETGITGIYHLKRMWSKMLAGRDGSFVQERDLDHALINMLGLGLLPFYNFVYATKPDFVAFEKWILAYRNNELPPELVQQCNALVTQQEIATSIITEQVLSANDIAHWNEHGYVILRNAVSTEDCAATCTLIWDFLNMKEEKPATWYQRNNDMQGIMVTLYNHPQIHKNRQNPLIRKAYEQLWGTTQLVVTADKVGFNPPEKEGHTYKGAGMHWDVSLATPIPFGTQGILYLTNTAENQGALRLVPGFHNKIETWLSALPPEQKPRQQNLAALGVKHMAANAGDFIIWHHALPHDGSPNTATKPRLVQYFNWFNPLVKRNEVWV